jgi:periplasmic divalent cation tolerance protein
MPPSQAAISFVSCPSEHAERIARHLVEARVAACVNLLPQIRSIYRWQDAVESADESLLLIKHPAQAFSAVRDAVLAMHPYELPEIVAVHLDEAHPPYLDWMLASCR